jgi:hypothetical protein
MAMTERARTNNEAPAFLFNSDSTVDGLEVETQWHRESLTFADRPELLPAFSKVV